MTVAPLHATDIPADDVASYLRAHPHFLAERPDLYRALAPPQRVHGDALADHMLALLRAERAHAAAMAERADFVLASRRAAAGLAARVQEAVLALIRADDPVECITAELPALLAVDAASLCVEALLQGARSVPEGMVAAILGSRAVILRSYAGDAPLLHGEATRLAHHEALVRVPGDGPQAMLALVARDANVLDASQGTAVLAFLGRAVAAALGR
jgi:uncharacterized protein YigA (DUF484 family)